MQVATSTQFVSLIMPAPGSWCGTQMPAISCWARITYYLRSEDAIRRFHASTKHNARRTTSRMSLCFAPMSIQVNPLPCPHRSLQVVRQDAHSRLACGLFTSE
ncbi:hypothetical protein MRB53_042071 [Persea americana]|nr:hypothetical protein MRB53_042071 [Persea americana]